MTSAINSSVNGISTGNFLGIYASTGALPDPTTSTGATAAVGGSSPYTLYSSNGSSWVVQGSGSSTYLGSFATTAALPPASTNVGNYAAVGGAAPFILYFSDGTNWNLYPTIVGNSALALLVNTSGAQADPTGQVWPGGDGTFEVMGTFAGANATLQTLGSDGVTWIAVSVATTLSAPGIATFNLKIGARVRCQIAGGSPTGIYSSVTQTPTVSGATSSLALLVNTSGAQAGSGQVWPGGAGEFEVMGTFAGATASLETLGVDTATWMALGPLTTTTIASVSAFTLKKGAQVRCHVTGGSPTGIYATVTQTSSW